VGNGSLSDHSSWNYGMADEKWSMLQPFQLAIGKKKLEEKMWEWVQRIHEAALM
jgi:hypothetical protein